MVLLVGASCLDNAYRSLSYTTILNPKPISPLTILQNLLKQGILETDPLRKREEGRKEE